MSLSAGFEFVSKATVSYACMFGWYALLAAPEFEMPARPGAVERALKFIRNNTNADGALGQMDETDADYPNYATALAVSVMIKAARKGHERDRWVRGEKTGGMEDDKAAFLKRIAEKEYLVHDLDNVKVEMHGDIAITYGRNRRCRRREDSPRWSLQFAFSRSVDIRACNSSLRLATKAS